MKQIPTSQVFAPRREPCAECGMPVFIAERLRIPHTPRTQNGEEDSGGGNSKSPNQQQSFLLMHRTCFRCARCHQQLSPAGGYYETESGAFCCEVCPDEERQSLVTEPGRSIRGDPEGTLAAGTDDEASDGEDEDDAATGSNMDSYSEDFESALEASGGVVDTSSTDVILNGAASSLEGTQLSSQERASDGAISSNAKSSSNSSYLSVKSHFESSPIIQKSGEILQENETKAFGKDRLSTLKMEAKEPESQLHEANTFQLTQRLHSVHAVRKPDDDGSDEVVIRKGETEKSSGEVNVPSARPFSVVDRVRMFEREVKVRQSLPKDSRSVVIKEKDQNEKLCEGNLAKKDNEITSAINSSVPNISDDNKVGNRKVQIIPNAEGIVHPEKERLTEVKTTVEDIPFMDESGDLSYNEEMTDLSLNEGTAQSSKNLTLLSHNEIAEDLSIKKGEEADVLCKKESFDIPSEKDESAILFKEEAAGPASEEIIREEIKDSAINVEPLMTTENEGQEVIVSTLEVKTESIGDVDHNKELEEKVKDRVEVVEIKEHLEDDINGDKIKEDVKVKDEIVKLAQKPERVEEKIEDKSELESHLLGESITFVIESPKDEDGKGEVIEIKGDVEEVPKPSNTIDYPEGLNPFGEDDEEGDKPKVAEVVRRKIIPVSLNPFGSSDEDEDEDEENTPVRRKLPVPAIRRSFNALDTLGRTEDVTAEDKMNPFWSAGEEDDTECRQEVMRRKSQSNINDPVQPVPKPRAIWSSVTSTPEPSPLPRRGASPTSSAGSTMTRRRRKKPAPPPPVPQTPVPAPRASTPTPQPSENTSLTSSPSLSISTATSPGGTPRRPRKSRPAPPRPVTPPCHDSPPPTGDNVPLLPGSSSSQIESPSETGENTAPKQSEVETVPMTCTRPPPESEKRQKDAENRNRRSRTSGGEEEDAEKEGVVAPVVSERVPDKSTFGQWKRKKGPAPPRPLPQKRKLNPHVPLSEIRRELCDIEVQQMELERQGVALERAIRSRFQQEDTPNDAWIPAEVEAQVLQLFELVNEKNELFRRQAELMYMRRQQRLEEEHADLEFQIRCLMERPASLKTDADKEREEMLIQRLVEVVQARDEVVQCLESDRLREAQEDVTVRARLAGAFPGKAAEKGEGEEDVEESSMGEKGKKSKKEKKVWERVKKKVVGKKGSGGGVLHLGKGKRKKDADKDVDEVEEGRRKEGGAW